MRSFVLDSSVTMSWYFADEAHPYAAAILESLNESEALVPAIWPIEIANVLLTGERRGRQTPAEAARFISMLSMLSIRVFEPPLWESVEELVDLGRQNNLSAYDASYLDLAMREGLPLATLDKRLQEAAGVLGVPLAVA